MALPDIQLDIDELMNDIITLNDTTLAEIDTIMTSACNSVALLTISGWEGKSKDEFLVRFSDYKTEMRLFCENLSQFNDCLLQIYNDGESLYTEGDTLLSAL